MKKPSTNVTFHKPQQIEEFQPKEIQSERNKIINFKSSEILMHLTKIYWVPILDI